MRKSRYSETQIIKALKEHESGKSTEDLCRELGINKATLYNWRKKYGGMESNELKRLKELEEENRKLKAMYADLALDHKILKDVLFKKVLRPNQLKERVDYVVSSHQISLKKACNILSLPRSVYYYRSVKDNRDVIDKLSELSSKYPTRGCDKYYDMIRLEGLRWNYKRVRRVYCLMKLNIRRKSKRRIPKRVKEPLTVPMTYNKSWSMDFMSDSLVTGRKVRVLNVIDDYNREAICIEAASSMPSQRVTRILDELVDWKGTPTQIRVDNGPEFISGTFKDWCFNKGINVKYIQPGRPMQNGFIERFNRSFREEVLDAYLFEDIRQVQSLSQQWMEDYNNNRPHESLNGLTPKKYIEMNNCI
ncbi:MAG: IS3 family transposase [Cytophagaceae bacterium]